MNDTNNIKNECKNSDNVFNDEVFIKFYWKYFC